jgi:hypothetical protein
VFNHWEVPGLLITGRSCGLTELRTSSFVQGLITRRADLAGAAFFAEIFFAVAFLAIPIPLLKIGISA